MYDVDPTNARWRTSRRSGANGNCVEVADNLEAVVAVRDSKDPFGPVLTFRPAAWTTFMVSLKVGAPPA
ncbi:DUF397 domain-containing protein [Micromonospora sp. WMMD1102]|uniref:DUF397 domain-containing protein n=1 Tax=Micromonospora sp. WMMD1102 TaxID=3016105 RepID=UPI00241504BD|nr:DUF397 domain-containing protein [Micromonospora sp. WMMD1102]MDG4786413.1 DUF397 domain-containing protein [Micromonospora sp. WMMD1102]